MSKILDYKVKYRKDEFYITELIEDCEYLHNRLDELKPKRKKC